MKFLALLFLSFYVASNSMIEFEMEHDLLNRAYLKYVPTNINLNNEIDLFIGLHGYTGTASGFEKQTTGGFNNAADKYGFIAIYPQGHHFNSFFKWNSSFISSWNDLVGSKTKTPNGEICSLDADIAPKYPNCNEGGRCSWTSCTDDLGFIKKIIDQAKLDHNIRHVYVLGMSNGGMMAQALACKYSDLFQGVVNIVGMQHKDLSCIPDKPVNFIIYGGMKDSVVPPITIKSSDGYFYEPMSNTFDSWANQFECKAFKKSNIDLHNKFKKNIASSCKNNVQVISILNKDAGHSWPGISKSAGYCYSQPQTDINYHTCDFSINNEWGNDFLLNLLFNLIH